jgi:sulfur dioxygenase
LPGGSIDSLYNSIFGTLLNITEDTVVYPAHDYQGNINTSLGYERINNPFLQERSPADFEKFVSAFFPPLDAEGGKLQCSITGEQQKNNLYFPEKNKTSPVMQELCFHLENFIKEAPPDFNAVDSEELQRLLKDINLTVVDVRERSELDNDGYIEKVLNIPLRELPENTAKLPADKDSLIVVLCRSGSRSSYAALYLRGLGYKNVKHLEGGMLDWLKNGYPVIK